MSPDTTMDSAHGDKSNNTTLVVKAVAAVIDKVHSLRGFPGWESARYAGNIASIIEIEAGSAPNVKGDDSEVIFQKKL